MDPNSDPTETTCFILDDIYESEAGVHDHFEQAMSSWPDFPALGAWIEEAVVEKVHREAVHPLPGLNPGRWAEKERETYREGAAEQPTG